MKYPYTKKEYWVCSGNSKEPLKAGAGETVIRSFPSLKKAIEFKNSDHLLVKRANEDDEQTVYLAAFTRTWELFDEGTY